MEQIKNLMETAVRRITTGSTSTLTNWSDSPAKLLLGKAKNRDGDIELKQLFPSDLNPQLDDAGGDFEVFRTFLTKNYRADFLSPNTANYGVAEMCYRKAISLGWSAEQFSKHFEKFVMRVKFPTFTVAEFFEGTNVDDVKLKTYYKYLKAVDETDGAINDTIHKFYFLNEKRDALTMFWCDKSELSEMQYSILKQREEHDRTELESIRIAS